MFKLSPKLGILIAALALVAPAGLWADTMISNHYRIQADDLNSGGTFSSSANYSLTDTLTPATPTGEGLASANYKACVGFQCAGGSAALSVIYAVSPVPCTGDTTSSPPYLLDLGSLVAGMVVTAPNHICLRVSANSTTSVAVAVHDVNNGLQSVSTPADVIGSNTATLDSTLPGYGICSYNDSGGFAAAWPYNGACDATHHSVGALTSGFQTLYSATGTLANAYGDVLVKAATTAATPAHQDYQDTLTVIVTGTY
jgi:hypothetical protein